MKTIIYILFVFLLFLNIIGFSYAETSTAEAYVRLEIINDVPEIQEVSFDSDVYYGDSVLKINTDVKDEFPEQLNFHYEWFVNGELISTKSTLEHEFEPGDEVMCIVTAEDSAHQYSNSVTVKTRINKSPASAVIIKKTMLLVGINDMKTGEVMDLQEKGLMSVTGFVAREADYSGGGFSTILLLMILVALIALNITMRIRINKPRLIKKENYLKQ